MPGWVFLKNKKIKCPFQNKHGSKIFSCPDKKWAFTMVFPPTKASTPTREKNGAKNDKRCPKKEPKELWGIPCDKPESLECEYPSKSKHCSAATYRCIKDKEGMTWVGAQTCS